MLATIGDSGESRFLALFLGTMLVFGIFVGAARAMLGRNEKTTWKDIVAGSMISGAASSMTGSALLYFWGSERALLIFPCCGIAAFGGLVFFDLAVGMITDKRDKILEVLESTKKRTKP